MTTELFAEHGAVVANRETFELVTHLGDARLLQCGWTYHPGPGMPCIYSTKTRAAVLAAQQLGYRVSQSASNLFESPEFVEDAHYAIKCEAARMELVKQEQERERVFWSEVEAIEAKLTADEIDTLRAAYRD